MNSSVVDKGKESEMNPDDDETDEDIIMQDPLSIVAVNYDEDANKEDCGKNDKVILQDYGEDGGDPSDGLVYDPEVLGYDAGSTHMANPFNAYHPFRTSLPSEMNVTTMKTANCATANVNRKRIDTLKEKASNNFVVTSTKYSGEQAETATQQNRKLALAKQNRFDKLACEEPEAKQRRLEKKASYKEKDTEEQCGARLFQERLHQDQVRAAESAEQRIDTLSEKASNNYVVISSKCSGKREETAIQRKQRLALAKQKRIEKLASEGPEEKRRRLEKRAGYREKETWEHREARLIQERQRKAQLRAAESAEQRTARLKKVRERMAQARASQNAGRVQQ